KRQNPIKWNYHDIIQGDFLDCEKICKKNYDLILGNPPWIRHEDIGVDQAPEYKDQIQSQIKGFFSKETFFDQKSDLYIYFCMMGLILLEKGGVLAFLTSNAWLEVKYGQTLQNFLLDPDKHVVNFDIIHRSGKRLWNRLGINSIILIAEKSSTGQAILSSGTFTETLVNFPQIPLSSLKKGLILSSNYEDQFYRTEQIPRDLLKKTHKWAGTFLRTSHSERKLIQRIGKKGVPLAYLADIRFGIKTGANDFFHLQRFKKQRSDGKVYVENRVGYTGLIEAKYLAPLIKSPSHIKGFVIPPSFLSSLWLFYCLDSPAQLKSSEAWTYIKWGENTSVTIKQGKKSGENILGFSSVRSVKQRDYWYSIGRYPIPSLLWTKSYHDKSGCFLNQAKMLPDQRFYGIEVKHDKFLPLIFTYLNSSFVWAQMETQGNTNMGFGVLDTNVYWLREIKIPVEAMVEKRQIMKLKDQLILEKNRVSMLDHSQIRSEIDLFFAKYLDVSDNSMKRLYNFLFFNIFEHKTPYMLI
ncbi:MAG: Eco57I restriction-modification methylase domain-containing protein, partial [Candidatus Hodarchaeales archaeon]